MRGSTVVILLTLTAAGVIYTLVVRRHASDKWWDWWNTLVATVLSVAMGVLAGFWVYDRQAREADERELSTIRLLLQAELSDAYISLVFSEGLSPIIQDRSYNVVLTYLHPLALEQAAKSGLFDNVDTDNFLFVARSMRVYDSSVDSFQSSMASFYAHPGDPGMLIKQMEGLNRQKGELIAAMLQITRQLKLDIRNGRQVWPPGRGAA